MLRSAESRARNARRRAMYKARARRRREEREYLDDATVRDLLEAVLRRLPLFRAATVLPFWLVRDPFRATCRLDDLELRPLRAAAVVFPADCFFPVDFFFVDAF